MPIKVDVMLSNSVVDAAERARALERAGVDGVFSFENSHDLFFPLVAAAPVCSLDLMTNVAIAFPRSPLHLAHAAYDLQLLSRGRFRLGLGSQVRAHVEKRYGARWGKPVAQMREWVQATKTILNSWQDGTRLDFRGEYTTHTLMTPAFSPGPNPYGVPKVLVGALGPRMNQMAAEVADGILVMPFNSDRHMRERTMPAIEAGLAAAGRSRADLEITAEVIVAVGRTEEELAAARAARGLLGFYGSTPSYRPVLEVEGWGDLQPELNARSKRGDWAGMTELITDEMFETIAVHGTPDQVADEIIRRYGDCDRVCAYFPGYQVGDDLIGDLARSLHAASAKADGQDAVAGAVAL
ncbi:TIGR03617 family F420-dependent LLM class oxidoreductase [Frankia sp. CNm7]|uniref:TIGR03617 family F420-dependent LLM class oxidoreductase n=1 Tax=Frankia nepalensis TaxID=1836974 RepID=A0A937UPM4_9ACTN|nr:TIGR03617 family F420-dependent LLM class oxidoreductase [Frankia nepalensis]MBL7496666.1 TIGR03617 family F420-dependent LLM class oxidoreductase [Frankia nepalensis]MBL7510692.1 TIGR03617 family F420-dependent LLM class oxidoreductase [Frankia nepalensis]MBL7516675.1 TIGR03617 family F420-dependent LLM class oxidoreductase [Frankia nepalensis]MBL7627405.1 TIGR03617 family F420-dependent LLM class oxidoreductase [Frankia nepalensis]